ncbi:xanthine dehydrogenase family protein molybdopterin-binding subunit [Sphingomonas sp. HF-S4]|uniref:Xanthine dehydrogenase family protein molybdopterin-binding subunit n=1 Tax=Sphingomonas agrestis TaxID=3080540 RepID=A0ABU3Y9X8_9SPHN|nr:xanthine dehydrogenase family protein molybdopterin-binding subunit [Sphingomonas sp. HF-S4]MDV3457942.1 xanthine dehydrogenase family protein molybdopterin-binding subunit [Sphingomonas sp. HF-S4]
MMHVSESPSSRRVDAPSKVVGGALYTADHKIDGVTYAVLVCSPIAHGRITSIDVEGALRMPGILGVVSHLNAAELRGLPAPAWPTKPEELIRRPDHGASLTFADAVIRYAGQAVAAVVADSLQDATAAAQALTVTYDADAPIVGLSEHEAEATDPQTGEIPGGEPATSSRGDAEGALSEAPIRVVATYKSPAAHHNPIEAPATIAQWSDGTLVVYDSNQGPHIIAAALASAFGLEKKSVRVISEFVGGAFGCKLQLWPHGYVAALAARLVKRPVKLVLTRPQMFTSVGHRPDLMQHVTLGADQHGNLLAIRHEAIVQTGLVDEYVEGCVGRTRTRYACPNVSVVTRLEHLSLPAGTSMRAPGKSTGSFALESAMDELAAALHMDPIELRLRNFASSDPDSGKPWSTSALKECYEVGAARFGWRSGGARRGGSEGRLLIGHGMASGSYPRYASRATASVVVFASGRATISTGVAEIGTGNTTVMPCIAAEALGLPADAVELRFGDTELPFAPQAGGSRIVASVGHAVLRACEDLKKKLAGEGLFGPEKSCVEILRELEIDSAEGYGAWEPDGPLPVSVESNAAHFCEVAVDPIYETIRVRRFVSAVDIGRVLSPVTARSQVLGAITMGLGQALCEETLVDPRFGRYLNIDLGEYLVPVSADVPKIDVSFVGEPDPQSGVLGAKSAGEIGIVGAAAAVANAVYDATGLRPRTLPIRYDTLARGGSRP